jgi:hypothetical protein
VEKIMAKKSTVEKFVRGLLKEYESEDLYICDGELISSKSYVTVCLTDVVEIYFNYERDTLKLTEDSMETMEVNLITGSILFIDENEDKELREITNKVATGLFTEVEILEKMKNIEAIGNLKVQKLLNGWEIHLRTDADNYCWICGYDEEEEPFEIGIKMMIALAKI